MVAPGWIAAQAVVATGALLGFVLAGLQLWGERRRRCEAKPNVPRPRQVLVRVAFAGAALETVRCVDPWGVHGVYSPHVYVSLSNFVTTAVYGVLGTGVYQITLAAEVPLVGDAGGSGSASVKVAAAVSTVLVIVFAGVSTVMMLAAGKQTTAAEVPFQLATVVALLFLNALTFRGVSLVAAEVREATAPKPGVSGNAGVREQSRKMAGAVRRLWRTMLAMGVFSALALVVALRRAVAGLAGDDEDDAPGEDPDAVELGTVFIALCQVTTFVVGVLFAWVPLRRSSPASVPSSVATVVPA